ncbi:hypothetical protein [Streptomyces sp. NPDC058623]|uniref:hypothetical protein n=1 Tax=Streptomyces sp. NPDC058623 TaxID=3346563 RepID=UPI003650D54E
MTTNGFKKRLAVLSVAAVVSVGVASVQAGAIGTELKLRGKATFCLSPEAARTLAAQSVTLEAIAPATVSGTCLTMPGTGTLASDISGGELLLQGGMRFAGTGHRLGITNMKSHIRVGEGFDTADVAVDDEPAKNLTIDRWPVSVSRVAISPTSVTAKDNPVTLTDAAKAAFTKAFGASPTAAGEPMFIFTAQAEITNPFGALPKP